MRRSRLFAIPLLAALLAAGVWNETAATDQISASEASHHVGKERTVCGWVASATYAARSRRQPTFLNLDEPYPRHIFTIVVWGSDRSQFREPPERAFRDENICVTGLISTYRDKPQIVVRQPAQISVQDDIAEENEEDA